MSYGLQLPGNARSVRGDHFRRPEFDREGRIVAHSETDGLSPGKRCRLRWSTQHLLGVYSPEFGILGFFLGVRSDGGQVGSSWEVLSQEQICIFIRCTLPGTLWIAEVDLHIRGYRRLLVLGHPLRAVAQVVCGCAR
jgi:hypothetical protein